MPPKSSWRTRLPFFYGWVVVGSIFCSQAIVYGAHYSFSVFFVALLEEFGWGRAPTAGVFAVFLMVGGLGGWGSGALVDRFGSSRVVSAGSALLALGLVATSRVSELWQFYLCFGVLTALGVTLSGWVPGVTVASRWFYRKRGAALGISSAGIGVAIVTMVPFAQYLISTVGWRSAYLAMAGIVLLGVAPQVMLLQVDYPEDLGLKPDGAAGAGASGAAPIPARQVRTLVVDEKWASYPWTVATAVRTPRFWLLGANFFLSVLTNQMLWVHQVAYLVDGGYDKMLAAGVAGLAGLISIPAKIFWGAAGDRLGREATYSIGIGAMLVALVALVLTRMVPGIWLVVIFAIAFSAGYAVTAPLSPSAAADVFGGRSFGSIYGVLSIGLGLGSALGAWLAGYIFDVSGSYEIAFAVAAASSTGGTLCIWLAAPRKVRRVPGRAR